MQDYSTYIQYNNDIKSSVNVPFGRVAEWVLMENFRIYLNNRSGWTLKNSGQRGTGKRISITANSTVTITKESKLT
ncbi:hypothetical protein RCL_jg25773.t1 [Rhizophagus clarus]|uniref:Uncharacterized protein n=1 Tax=Rhizophagus clarus TaxID=94130 RepID=A0A8H3LRU9_9GLOM|nr:hypothetical protein RCL_jg25773.t1 [Rhizophagus clarus]